VTCTSTLCSQLSKLCTKRRGPARERCNKCELWACVGWWVAFVKNLSPSARAKQMVGQRALLALALSNAPVGALRLPLRVGGAKPGGTLVLVRHGDTEWTGRGVFTGWADPPLSDEGEAQVSTAARALKESGYTFDVAYTSMLKRTVQTTWLLLKELSLVHLTVHKDWRLNERSYGALTGQTLAEACDTYGVERVASWRRSITEAPPDYPPQHPHNPAREPRYARWQDNDGAFSPVPTPGGESLGDTIERCLPVWTGEISNDLRDGKRVLVVAHGNTIRAIMRAIDGVADAAVSDIEVPTCMPLVYRFERSGAELKPIRATRRSPWGCLGSTWRARRTSARPRLASARRRSVGTVSPQLGLYTTFVHSKAFSHKSTVLLFPRPPTLPTRLPFDCKTIAQHTTPLPTLLLYAIHYTILVMAISCKGQATTHKPRHHIRFLPPSFPLFPGNE